MNLDDLSLLSQIDTQDMLGQIDSLPDQLATAWEFGQSLPLPLAESAPRYILLAGVGASALGADLVAAYVAETCPVPVMLHRDYSLPAFAHGPETLVVALSHSGNDEETLEVFNSARKAGCSLIVLSGRGKLAHKAVAGGFPCWTLGGMSQDNAALGSIFGLLLALFNRLGLIPDQKTEIATAVEAMREQQEKLLASVPAALNPAKRYAGQLVGRWVTIFGSGLLAPVVWRWKQQFNTLAKAPANVEILPEADHNALAGLSNPADLLQSRTLTMFLVAPSDHPRNRLRSDLTRQVFMLEGSNTDFYLAKGSTKLAQLWTALHFGDYLAYYLAIAYQIDPTPLDALDNLKELLGNA